MFDREIWPTNPVKKLEFFDGMRGSDRSIERVGIENALVRQYKKTRSVRSETGFSTHVPDCTIISLRRIRSELTKSLSARSLELLTRKC